MKNLPANAGDAGSVPGTGRSRGEGNDNSLQYSCLGNPMDRGALWALVHGVKKESDMTRHDLAAKQQQHNNPSSVVGFVQLELSQFS